MKQPPPRTTVDRRVAAPLIVAIGASTGGPQALRDLLSRLPADFAPPILIVQHIAAGFVPSLQSFLSAEVQLPIQVAESGQRLVGPGAYIAPTETHLEVRQRRVLLSDTPPVSGHRPSATVLFRSVAKEYGSRAIGVVLTGMGDDGAAGLVAIRNAGGRTLAQDQATSAVFGMPRAAQLTGAVEHMVAIDDMADAIVRAAGRIGS